MVIVPQVIKVDTKLERFVTFFKLPSILSLRNISDPEFAKLLIFAVLRLEVVELKLVIVPLDRDSAFVKFRVSIFAVVMLVVLNTLVALEFTSPFNAPVIVVPEIAPPDKLPVKVRSLT